jgi:6-phosphogluconolactonase/glucosamine-6-phosphate isomerase/deaminase
MWYLFEAKQVVLQVTGAKKAEIIRKVYHSAPAMRLPGTVMQLLEKNRGIVVLDEAAAAQLDPKKLDQTRSLSGPCKP